MSPSTITRAPVRASCSLKKRPSAISKPWRPAKKGVVPKIWPPTVVLPTFRICETTLVGATWLTPGTSSSALASESVNVRPAVVPPSAPWPFALPGVTISMPAPRPCTWLVM
ncbi:hypothetical protein D3C72_492260 [compost metagenome]